jgi:GT2 family glycosyltransferase
VIELEATRPFTAARGRNAGFSRMTSNPDAPEFVQFVDGDCELAPAWLQMGEDFLREHSRAAVAYGRLRERFPEASVYNRMCDLEWDEASIGETRACGGIAMMRAAALRETGGFREDLIAGEEPELCVRLRERGWAVYRITGEMASHDAAMTQFGQWWKRAVRAGHAYAEGAWLHGGGKDRHGLRPVLSAAAWAVVIPAGALALAPVTRGWSLLAMLFYPLQWMRLTLQQWRRGRAPSVAWRHAALLIVGKWAHVAGMVRFAAGSLARRPQRLIEYKQVESPTAVEARP